MGPSFSIQIAWSLAGQEAFAAGSQFIEPVHFLLGTLKFSEIEESEIASITSDNSITNSLINERDQVCGLLRKLAIRSCEQSRTIRRTLRKKLGKGKYRHDGDQVMHRSQASRELCRQAEEGARANGLTAWNASHLMHALHDALAEEIIADLSKVAHETDPVLSENSGLRRFGREILSNPGNMPLTSVEKGPGSIPDLVCRVAAEALLEKENSVLLIRKGRQKPAEVVEGLSGYLRSPAARFRDRFKRIIEIDLRESSWLSKAVRPTDLENRMRKIFRESAEAGNIFIFINDLDELLTTATGADYTDALMEYSATASCIFGADENSYRLLMKYIPGWKKKLRHIWMHDIEVPFEL